VDVDRYVCAALPGLSTTAVAVAVFPELRAVTTFSMSAALGMAGCVVDGGWVVVWVGEVEPGTVVRGIVDPGVTGATEVGEVVAAVVLLW